MRILFVCTVNKYRSKTAEKVFGDYEQYETKSAGIDKEAVVQLNQELLDWADLIVVMEKGIGIGLERSLEKRTKLNL